MEGNVYQVYHLWLDLDLGFLPSLYHWTYGRIFGKWLPTEQVPSCSPLVKGKYLNLLLQIGGYLCGEILPPGGVPRSTTGLWRNWLWGSKTWFLGIENAVGFFLFHLRYVLSLIRGVLISSLENLTLYPQGREYPKSVSGFFLDWNLLEPWLCAQIFPGKSLGAWWLNPSL